MIEDFEKVVDFLEGPGVRNWQFTSEGVKLVNIRNLVNDNLELSNTSNHLSFEEVNNKYNHFLLKEGEFVMASSGVTWGKIAEVKKEHLPLCLNTSIIKLVPKTEFLNKRYLWHFIKNSTFRQQINRLITGSAQPNFGPSHLKKIKIPLPPLPEQKRIADLLDIADQLRQKDKALLEKYDQLAQSLFLEMFGDPVKNEKGWEVKKLSDFISKLETGISVNSRDEPYDTRKFGILKTSCVYTGHFREMEAKVINDNEISRAKLHPRKDSLIISRMNTTELVGKSVYIDKDYPNLFLPDRLWQTVPGSSYCNYRWLHYTLNHTSFMDSISKVSSGTSGSMKNISKQSFLNLNCISPSFPLQNQFAEQVQLIEQQKELAKKNLEKSEELFGALMGEVFRFNY